MQDKKYLISDASKLVEVESHVLRYWEEELALPIKRNELGHRYYTKEDITCFREIKKMKEQGLQLKAIRMYLKDGKIYHEDMEGFPFLPVIRQKDTPIESSHPESTHVESVAEKQERLQILFHQLFTDVLTENNEKICQNIRDTVLKELDYQFRQNEEREEEHYKKIDELLRSRSKGQIRKERKKKHPFG